MSNEDLIRRAKANYSAAAYGNSKRPKSTTPEYYLAEAQVVALIAIAEELRSIRVSLDVQQKREYEEKVANLSFPATR